MSCIGHSVAQHSQAGRSHDLEGTKAAAFGEDAQLRSLPGGEAERRVLFEQFVC